MVSFSFLESTEWYWNFGLYKKKQLIWFDLDVWGFIFIFKLYFSNYISLPNNVQHHSPIPAVLRLMSSCGEWCAQIIIYFTRVGWLKGAVCNVLCIHQFYWPRVIWFFNVKTAPFPFTSAVNTILWSDLFQLLNAAGRSLSLWMTQVGFLSPNEMSPNEFD